MTDRQTDGRMDRRMDGQTKINMPPDLSIRGHNKLRRTYTVGGVVSARTLYFAPVGSQTSSGSQQHSINLLYRFSLPPSEIDYRSTAGWVLDTIAIKLKEAMC